MRVWALRQKPISRAIPIIYSATRAFSHNINNNNNNNDRYCSTHWHQVTSFYYFWTLEITCNFCWNSDGICIRISNAKGNHISLFLSSMSSEFIDRTLSDPHSFFHAVCTRTLISNLEDIIFTVEQKWIKIF